MYLFHYFAQLKGSETKMFVAWLIEIFERGFVEGVTETE